MYSQLSIHDQWPINCLLLINHRLISYHNQNGQVVDMLHIYWKPVPNWNLFGISGTDFWPRFRPKGGREVFVWRRHTWQSILLKIIQSTTVFSAKCKLSRPLPCWNTDYLDHMDWFFYGFHIVIHIWLFSVHNANRFVHCLVGAAHLRSHQQGRGHKHQQGDHCRHHHCTVVIIVNPRPIQRFPIK